MTLSAIAVLFFTMLALALLPSSSVALVVGRSATAGVANGLACAAGIVAGDLVFLALALGGMAALAERLGGFFLAVRISGGVYLIWIGIGILRSAGKAAPPLPQRANGGSLLMSFLGGLALTLGDVKAILFYASLLPMFVDLASLGVGDVATVALVTVAAVGGVKTAYALVANRLVRSGRRERLRRPARILGGCVLTGAGAYLVLKQ